MRGSVHCKSIEVGSDLVRGHVCKLVLANREVMETIIMLSIVGGDETNIG